VGKGGGRGGVENHYDGLDVIIDVGGQGVVVQVVDFDLGSCCVVFSVDVPLMNVSCGVLRYVLLLVLENLRCNRPFFDLWGT
jgi:hypothetical protein